MPYTRASRALAAMNSQPRSFAACHQVLAVPELFQLILLNLSTQELSVAAHVSIDWSEAVKKLFLVHRIPGGWNLAVKNFNPVGKYHRERPGAKQNLQVTYTSWEDSRSILFAVRLRKGKEYWTEYVDLMCDSRGPWWLLAPEAQGFMASVDDKGTRFTLQLRKEGTHEPYLDVSFRVQPKRGKRLNTAMLGGIGTI